MGVAYGLNIVRCARQGFFGITANSGGVCGQTSPGSCNLLVSVKKAKFLRKRRRDGTGAEVDAFVVGFEDL